MEFIGFLATLAASALVLFGMFYFMARVDKQVERDIREWKAKEASMLIDSNELAFAVLDLETQRLAHEVKGGWNNPGGFGLSVACTWDTLDGFQDWYEGDVPKMVAHLKSFPLIVGFNILGFDYKVLDPYCSTSGLRSQTVDILGEINRQLGYRVRLNDLAQATLGRSKSGIGTDAVEWWRQGDKDKVIAYCRDDVEITRDLFLYGLRHGSLKYPRYGQIATVSLQLK